MRKFSARWWLALPDPTELFNDLRLKQMQYDLNFNVATGLGWFKMKPRDLIRDQVIGLAELRPATFVAFTNLYHSN